MGNLFSVARRISATEGTPFIASDASELKKADKIILPGVGYFRKGMDNLRHSGMNEALQEHALVRRKPILGICLGMQLMADYSEEGDCEGLGWVPAHFEKLPVTDALRYKVPHTGWNQVAVPQDNELFRGIAADAEFYFIHTYGCLEVAPEYLIGHTTYSHRFVSAYGRDHIFGVQFHPEKSHQQGHRLLQNFMDL